MSEAAAEELPKWARYRETNTTWTCDTCGTLYPTVRKRFGVYGMRRRYDRRTESWKDQRSEVCGYCYENHRVWGHTR